ncbi:hypothetical protein C943_01177 [Mariniradius saccharolyticus AK6]|uniref:Uncharacterized protein n=1 Tax=Mariniradius saccharolyticus AK6 TaxID=1239962 RepID=M7X4T5_9BACT|nr:hypothetical protein C943_01177 [Mariniradius saccharolyticus AK6]
MTGKALVRKYGTDMKVVAELFIASQIQLRRGIVGIACQVKADGKN